jgi:hypothetical protein
MQNLCIKEIPFSAGKTATLGMTPTETGDSKYNLLCVYNHSGTYKKMPALRE